MIDMSKEEESWNGCRRNYHGKLTKPWAGRPKGIRGEGGRGREVGEGGKEVDIKKWCEMGWEDGEEKNNVYHGGDNGLIVPPKGRFESWNKKENSS